MISNELVHILYGYESYDYMVFDCMENGEFVPSLNDVAAECKEWAFDKGYTIYSAYQGYIIIENLIGSHITEFDEDTEVDGVFKATEWVRVNCD